MQLTNTVSPGEPLARYLTSSRNYSSKMQAVKPAAFLPPPNCKLSVFRVAGLALQEACQIGQQQVIGGMLGRRLHGFAEIEAWSFQYQSLTILPDNDPPRHASVVGWPAEKERQKLIAIELAASASLVMCA